MAFFALLCVSGIPVVFVGHRIDKFGLDSVSIIVLSLSFPMIAELMYYVLATLPQRQLRQLGLTCPNCGVRLLGFNAEVVARGLCRCCGRQVLEFV